MTAPKPHRPNISIPTRQELIAGISELVRAKAHLLVFNYPCEQQELFEEQEAAAEQNMIELIDRIPNLQK